MFILTWIAKLFAAPLLGQLAGIYERKLAADTDRFKTGVVSDQAIILKQIEGEIEARKVAAASRAADRGSMWTAWMLPTAFGLCMVHFGAIVLDSTFKFAWSVDKLPPPYDQIEQSIILAVAGVVGVTKVARIFSR